MTRVLVAVVLAMGLLTGCSSPAKKADTGLPEVTLKGLRDSDRPVDIGNLKGPMVINLWAQWCGPCREELPIYQAFHVKHPRVKVLGVDTMDPQRDLAIAMLKQAGADYPQVVDPDRTFRSAALPKLILVDARGRIAFQRAMEITSLGQLEKLVDTHLGER